MAATWAWAWAWASAAPASSKSKWASTHLTTPHGSSLALLPNPPLNTGQTCSHRTSLPCPRPLSMLHRCSFPSLRTHLVKPPNVCLATSAIRTLSTSARTMYSAPRFSSGVDEAATSAALGPLLESEGGRWTLTNEGEALERSFKFKTFAKTWDFMTAVALQCKIKNHHPEWSNVYNTTFIRWTTHSPKGLSEKDVGMAAVCDSIAKDFGELAPEPVSCEVRDVANKATTLAGDCCTPKK